jgi:hypothetical protein
MNNLSKIVILLFLVSLVCTIYVIFFSKEEKSFPEVEDKKEEVDVSVPDSIDLPKEDATPVSTPSPSNKPKRKYNKRKKKPAVTENTTNQKRPVTKPKKSN